MNVDCTAGGSVIERLLWLVYHKQDGWAQGVNFLVMWAKGISCFGMVVSRKMKVYVYL